MLSRAATFVEDRLPLRANDQLKHIISRTGGPIGFLNPTRTRFEPLCEGSESEQNEDTDHEEPADAVQFKWTSRNNRKGRHQLEFIPAADPQRARYLVPERTSSPREILKNISRMFTHYPYWDISWVVAYIFTWGSIVWVINAL
jgi:hypothetical protein